MRYVMALLVLLVVLAGCASKTSPCDQYVDRFVQASRTCDTYKMGSIALTMNATLDLDQCPTAALRRFHDAARNCGYTAN